MNKDHAIQYDNESSLIFIDILICMQTSRKKQAFAQQNQNTEAKSWRDAKTRNDRSRLIREALFKAAAEVVGELGYQDASITFITQRAGVAQGTFYNHFASRQDILDRLLPTLGRNMLDYIREYASRGSTYAAREELGFRGFFAFLKETPYFFRILNEAESFAPDAYRAHLDLVSKGYVRFLKQAVENGEFQGYDERELEVVAFTLMAARSYLAWRYVYGEEKRADVPEWVVKAYVKMVTRGLLGSVQDS